MANYGQATGELNQGALGFNHFYARSFYLFDSIRILFILINSLFYISFSSKSTKLILLGNNKCNSSNPNNSNNRERNQMKRISRKRFWNLSFLKLISCRVWLSRLINTFLMLNFICKCKNLNED